MTKRRKYTASAYSLAEKENRDLRERRDVASGWKDASPRHRTGPATSEIHELRAGDLRITVVYGNINNPTRWLLTCEPFYREYEIPQSPTNADDAKEYAIACMSHALGVAIAEMNRA